MKTIDIAFNKDNMTISDLKACASALESILDQFSIQLQLDESQDWSNEQAEEFCMRVLQMRDSYTTARDKKTSCTAQEGFAVAA